MNSVEGVTRKGEWRSRIPSLLSCVSLGSCGPTGAVPTETRNSCSQTAGVRREGGGDLLLPLNPGVARPEEGALPEALCRPQPAASLGIQSEGPIHLCSQSGRAAS